MSISLKANAAGTQGEVLLNGTPVQTFNQNTLQVSGNVLAGAAQSADPAALTRKDYVDGIVCGVGQMWQDLTASRAAATNYTNNTGKPIMVLLTFGNTAVAGSADVIVDGVTIAQPNAMGNGPRQGCSFIVPNGSVYRTNVSGGVAIQKWAELR